MTVLMRSAAFLFCLALADDPVELNNEAVILIKEGRYEQAVRKLVTALNLAPDSKVIRENLAAAYAQRGNDAGRHGNLHAAIEDLRAACRHAPAEVMFHHNLAVYLYRSGELSLAEDAVERALTLPDPGEMEAGLKRLKGNILYLQDRLEDALNVFESLPGSGTETGEAGWMASKIKRELSVQREYQQDLTAHFKILYGPGPARRSAREPFVTVLEEERAAVCADLNHFPRKRVTAIIYEPEDFKAVTAAEAWVGGLFDRKIRIPLSDVDRNLERLRLTVRHEYTHVIMYELAPGCPAWINEGLATCEQYGHRGGAGRKRMAELVSRGRKPESFDRIPASFIEVSEASMVELYYAQSHAMIEYLIDHYGLGRIRLFLRELNKEGDWKTAFRSTYSREFTDLENDWLAEFD